MEIYKLSDDVPTTKPLTNHKHYATMDDKAANAAQFSDVLRITDIKQAVRSENRVNIYLNGKYSFSLDLAQVVDLGIKIGRVITPAELDDFRRASAFGKAYQRALEWALTRPHSVRELRDYLRRRAFTAEAKERQQAWRRDRELAEAIARGEDISHSSRPRKTTSNQTTSASTYDFDDLIVERLVARGYIDDRKFAEYYIENRFVKKGISAKRLRLELREKGIAPDLIDELLATSTRSDEDEIRKIIAKKRAKYDDAKLIQYLCRQGFPYDLVKSLVEESASAAD